MSEQQYLPLENSEGSSEFSPQLEKEQIYTRRDTLYRNAFFYILTVYAVLLVLWIFSIVEKGKNTQSITAPNAILESLQHNVTVVFKPYERFQNLSLHQGKEDPWESLQPPGRGFIEIPEYNSSEGGLIETTSKHYSISVFHQLHCLATLKDVFAKLISPSVSLSQSTDDHIQASEHVRHCIDFLRQAVMCAADTNLEETQILRPNGSDGLPTRGASGWGAAHSCRDYNVVWEFAKSHRYRNDTGIL